MRTIISFTLVSVMALTAFAQWSGNVQDQIICYEDNLQCWYSRMAVDSEGAIHVVWAEKVVSYPTQQEIHYSRSNDNGYNWSAINQDFVISYDDGVNVENSSSIAIDSQDNIYVIWTELEGPAKEVMFSISSDGGDTWTGQSMDQYLSFRGGTDAYNPEMVIDGNDVIHVVWDQDWIGDINEIYYSRSTDGGLTWSSQTQETIVSFPDGQYASYADIALGPNEELYVIWKEKRDVLDDRWVINVSISTDGGDTWSGTMADTPITIDYHIASNPHIAVDANGIIHTTWQGTPTSTIHYEIYYSKSEDGGTSWSGLTGERMISWYGPGDGSVFNPNLGVDHGGAVMAVWNEDYLPTDQAEPHISISLDGGDTWTGESQNIFVSCPGDNPGYRPFIVAGIDDTLHVTWNERAAGSYYQIHYSRGDAVSQPSLPEIADLTVQIEEENARLSWAEVSGASSYTIYRSINPYFLPTTADSIGFTTTAGYEDIGVLNQYDEVFYIVISSD